MWPYGVIVALLAGILFEVVRTRIAVGDLCEMLGSLLRRLEREVPQESDEDYGRRMWADAYERKQAERQGEGK